MEEKMFVLFDNETKMFLGKNGGYGKQHASVQNAHKYKRKSSAIDAASLHNVSRNVPQGMTANHKYSNRPQVEVLELDHLFVVQSVHSAPPNYIYL
jgi:hypothetical protein